MSDANLDPFERELLYTNLKEYLMRTTLLYNLVERGLGIGMLNAELMCMRHVSSVTIVEKSTDVIGMVWPHCPKDDRFRLVHADLDNWAVPAGAVWDYAWFDTWLSLVNGDLSEYASMLVKRYSPYCRRIDFWPGFRGL